MKKYIALLLTLCLLLCSCGAQQAPIDPAVEDSISPATEVPTVPEETAAPYVESGINYNEYLTNIWDIMDNECVEEIPILPGLLLDDIADWMEETEFKEIKLHQRTYWDSVRLGVYEEIAVAQISMLKSNNLDGETLVWNVRMEKSDSLKNKTAIEIPEDASVSDIFVFSNKNQQIPGIAYFWENGDGTYTQIYQYYFEKTHNLYTFYSKDVTASNSGRSPDVVLNHIANDGADYYDWPNGEAIQAGKNSKEPVISYFRVRLLGGEEVTYQYQVGMNLAQWAHSEYNTDGWTTTARDDSIIISADGRYSMASQRYPWRVVQADLYGLATTETDVIQYPYGSVQHTGVESELRIDGMYLYSPAFHEFCDYRYGMTGLSDSYSYNDTILVSGIGVTPEEVAGMEVIMIPHTENGKTMDDIENNTTHNSAYGWPYGNNYATVKQKGTVLELEYKTIDDLGSDYQLLKEFHLEHGIFTADYTPLEDPNFSPYADVDIAIAWNGQIVYWVFLNQFYNN